LKLRSQTSRSATEWIATRVRREPQINLLRECCHEYKACCRERQLSQWFVPSYSPHFYCLFTAPVPSYSTEHLKKEIFEANERIAALKRQALLVQASTLALVNQAQLDTELADTSSKMTAMGADSDETEELYLAHLQKKAEELQQQLDQIDKEIQSAEGTSASQTDVDQPPTTLDELLDAVTKFDPESATSRETFTLTKALAENLLQQLNPALEEMYKSIEDELRTIATSSGSPLNSIQLESILCTKARGEEECGTSILVSFAETCQQILERVETTSKMANRLLNAPLDEIQKQYDQITSTLSG